MKTKAIILTLLALLIGFVLGVLSVLYLSDIQLTDSIEINYFGLIFEHLI